MTKIRDRVISNGVSAHIAGVDESNQDRVVEKMLAEGRAVSVSGYRCSRWDEYLMSARNKEVCLETEEIEIVCTEDEVEHYALKFSEGALYDSFP